MKTEQQRLPRFAVLIEKRIERCPAGGFEAFDHFGEKARGHP